MDREAFVRKLEQVEDLPTLPSVAMEVNRLLEDEDVSIRKLTDTIEKDQSIVSKILKLVNSAFFGLRSRVDNISHAVTLLGFNTVRNAVLSVSVIKTFGGVKPGDGFSMADFWRHAVAVGITARFLGQQTRLASPDNGFIAGLLHDMGKVVLSAFFPEIFREVLQGMARGASFYEAERDTSPMDHARIGGFLARQWQLPRSLTDAIRCHHAVKQSAADYRLLLLVHAADLVSVRVRNEQEGAEALKGLHPEALKAVRSQLDNFHDWSQDLREEIDTGCRFFLEELDS